MHLLHGRVWCFYEFQGCFLQGFGELATCYGGGSKGRTMLRIRESSDECEMGVRKVTASIRRFEKRDAFISFCFEKPAVKERTETYRERGRHMAYHGKSGQSLRVRYRCRQTWRPGCGVEIRLRFCDVYSALRLRQKVYGRLRIVQRRNRTDLHLYLKEIIMPLVYLCCVL